MSEVYTNTIFAAVKGCDWVESNLNIISVGISWKKNLLDVRACECLCRPGCLHRSWTRPDTVPQCYRRCIFSPLVIHLGQKKFPDTGSLCGSLLAGIRLTVFGLIARECASQTGEKRAEKANTRHVQHGGQSGRLSQMFVHYGKKNPTCSPLIPPHASSIKSLGISYVYFKTNRAPILRLTHACHLPDHCARCCCGSFDQTKLKSLLTQLTVSNDTCHVLCDPPLPIR